MAQNGNAAARVAAPATAQSNQIPPQNVEEAARAVKRTSLLGDNRRKAQTIFRAAKNRPYTAISNAFLQNPDVPYDVKGFVSECLSRPDDWRVSVAGVLSTNNTIRSRGIRSIMAAAEKHGFLRGVRNRTARGTLSEVMYFVSDDADASADAQRDYLAKNIRSVAVAIDRELKNRGGAPQVEPSCAWSNVAKREPRCSSQHAVASARQSKEETNSKNLFSTMYPREDGDMASVLLLTAGLSLDLPATSPFRNTYIPAGWVSDGCDLALDILPAVRNVAAKAGRSGEDWWIEKGWWYFTKAVMRRRNARLRQAGQPPEEAWQGGASGKRPFKANQADIAEFEKLGGGGELPKFGGQR